MSARRRYSRRQRLGTADIASLLSSGRALKRPGFSVLFRANLLGVPRLGLIVPKRVFPRAVDRSRMKRLLRELFRAQQARLGSRDILIRLTAGTVALAEVERCLLGSS
ncbi:MAG: ribonuclease P protein component [Betaproteobacteria bacterium]|nr:MAG: ribonuclease P protein component [Betaproteobacteria bacterium]TMH83934.1 MAG: ribonuclease P protein component [Betaproteobacteria bacterium]